MRLSVLVLLALPALLPAGASAQATLNKCIDAAGQVTYSNLPCRGAREVKRVEIDQPPPPPRPAPASAVPPPVPPQASPPQAQPAPTRVQPVTPQALPAPMQPQPASLPPPPVTAMPAPRPQPSPAAVRPPRAGQSAARASTSQCDTLSDQLGRVFDKMDQARAKGATQEQMDKWNLEVTDLERKKQQSGCF